MKGAADAESRHRTPEKERKIREASLDQTIKDSFPASDPPSTNPNPGVVSDIVSNKDERSSN